uniref:Uncharacterized protein n=1 Tax=Oryza brachyantha TaxID=4533 RepID=J3MC54_ORYBR
MGSWVHGRRGNSRDGIARDGKFPSTSRVTHHYSYRHTGPTYNGTHTSATIMALPPWWRVIFLALWWAWPIDLKPGKGCAKAGGAGKQVYLCSYISSK